MTPNDDTIDIIETKRVTGLEKRMPPRTTGSLLKQQREAAEKWQADNKKNALLFPYSYDFS